ncbi:hypothetical protein F5H01DRAFT_349784 [Linnemannia elongata]|nr:hypothetical protein F5H01DRAFT_349784 [Linnemannia elongata]
MSDKRCLVVRVSRRNDLLVPVQGFLAQVSDFGSDESKVATKDVECFDGVDKNRVLDIQGIRGKDRMHCCIDWSGEVGKSCLDCCHVLVVFVDVFMYVNVPGAGERRGCIFEVLNSVKLFDVGVVFQFVSLGVVEEFVTLFETGEPFLQSIIRLQGLDRRFC